MGSSATLVKQSALFVLLTAFVAWTAPAEAKAWVVIVGAGSLGLFLAVSLYRHAQIKRLAAEIDEVLHNGRRISFSNSHEGDVAILSNELEKMVARLTRTSEQLAAERNGLADTLADVSHRSARRSRPSRSCSHQWSGPRIPRSASGWCASWRG